MQREDKFKTYRIIQIDKLIREKTFPSATDLHL